MCVCVCEDLPSAEPIVESARVGLLSQGRPGRDSRRHTTELLFGSHVWILIKDFRIELKVIDGDMAPAAF